MESKAKTISEFYGIHEHRLDELITVCRAAYAVTHSTNDFMNIVKAAGLHHDGEKELVHYLFGCMRGASATVEVFKARPFILRLMGAFFPSRIQIQ